MSAGPPTSKYAYVSWRLSPRLSPRKIGQYRHPSNGGNHGLGHLLNPIDPDSENTDWIGESWKYLIANALGIPNTEPSWLDRPAISRLSISSPHLYHPFENERSRYCDRVKPFNFALSAHVAMLGHPDGVDPKRFHLVAPYERDARKWLRMKWTDIHSGAEYSIATGSASVSKAVRVKSFRDVLEAFATHPEPKSAAPDGSACGLTTRGLLARRPVLATGVFYVGKESKQVEEVEQGIVHDWDEVARCRGVPQFVRRSPKTHAERAGRATRPSCAHEHASGTPNSERAVRAEGRDAGAD